ncbi:hypothetical protein [Wolbachia endosymbiont (group B) of Ischnura elegans]|uniref:hypothetical protein n=1 Tax=Wolbachia endosymbiont (group B) of Ischnura elegans TaxID=2954021 RepID=UPI002231F2B9|nr:hypothetical protein [Wolbachia endosymbiont (group B) of Ischnura elegans]
MNVEGCCSPIFSCEFTFLNCDLVLIKSSEEIIILSGVEGIDVPLPLSEPPR